MRLHTFRYTAQRFRVPALSTYPFRPFLGAIGRFGGYSAVRAGDCRGVVAGRGVVTSFQASLSSRSMSGTRAQTTARSSARMTGDRDLRFCYLPRGVAGVRLVELPPAPKVRQGVAVSPRAEGLGVERAYNRALSRRLDDTNLRRGITQLVQHGARMRDDDKRAVLMVALRDLHEPPQGRRVDVGVGLVEAEDA